MITELFRALSKIMLMNMLEYSLDAFIRVTVLRASVYKNKKVCHKSL